MMKKAKKNFYNKMVQDLVEKDQNQWYSQYKRLTSQGKAGQIVVEEISHLSEQAQAKSIADHITAISNEYEHLKSEDIEVPDYPTTSIPHILVSEVKEKLAMIKINKSTAPGDVPANLIKVAAEHIAEPLTDVINASILLGQWPDTYKLETITPAPKIQPPKLMNDLRPITNLFTYCKIGEKIICELMVEDMVKHMDPSQYGNLKNTSIQQYIILK